jgi:hypothetical protein
MEPHPEETSVEASGEIKMNRRRLLKTLAAAGGAAAASSLLPGKWARPLLEVGVLPAHAQISPVLGTGDLQVTLTWDLDDSDIDLHCIEPDTTHVYFGNPSGTTAELDLDDVDGFGPENIFVEPGTAAAGTYEIYVHYWSDHGNGPTTATIRVRVFANTPQEQTQIFTRYLTTGQYVNVADVTFPAGTIVETFGAPASTGDMPTSK